MHRPDEIVIVGDLPEDRAAQELLGRYAEVPVQHVDLQTLANKAGRMATLGKTDEQGGCPRRVLVLLPRAQLGEVGHDDANVPASGQSQVLEVVPYELKTGINASPEFARKLLADFGVNVGLSCGHNCRFCSSRCLFRHHPAFRHFGLNPYTTRCAIVDPHSVRRVQRDARTKKRRGLVMLCTASDAWSPEAQAFGLGRGCAGAILDQPGWTLRVLTKNAAVREDFALFERHRERVVLGLSTSFLPSDRTAAVAVEPNASLPQERVDALVEAHRRGIRTFGMLCPLIPAFYRGQGKVDEAFKAVLPAEPEEIFAEVVNPRGRALVEVAESLRLAGLTAMAKAVDGIRSRRQWSHEAATVIEMAVDAARRLYDIKRLHVLVYPSGLTCEDEQALRQIPEGLVWLR